MPNESRKPFIRSIYIDMKDDILQKEYANVKMMYENTTFHKEDYLQVMLVIEEIIKERAEKR